MEQALEKLAGRKGYRVQKSRDAFAGRKFYLSYKSASGTEDRIELDLNFLFRVPIAGIEKHNLWQPGELNRHEIWTVSLQEIVIGKMLATLDRGSCRDFRDMANLPSHANEVKNLPSFRACLLH